MNANTVLVVDDEESIRTMYDTALSSAGYNVLMAADADEALEVIGRSAVQVMFLDLQLPGMNGIELCRKIKALKPTAICIAITGHSSVFDLVACREAGFDDYFPKPISIAELIKASGDAFEKTERWVGVLSH